MKNKELKLFTIEMMKKMSQENLISLYKGPFGE